MRIAECANRILVLLEQTPEVNFLHLSELLEERNVIAYQALGRLARDQKIRHEQRGSQFFISRHIGGHQRRPINAKQGGNHEK
jgi:primosomal protein N''